MPCCRACSSRKSNMYFIANGRAELVCAVLKIVLNKSSTNFCSVSFVDTREVRSPSEAILFVRSLSRCFISFRWTRCQTYLKKKKKKRSLCVCVLHSYINKRKDTHIYMVCVIHIYIYIYIYCIYIFTCICIYTHTISTYLGHLPHFWG